MCEFIFDPVRICHCLFAVGQQPQVQERAAFLLVPESGVICILPTGSAAAPVSTSGSCAVGQQRARRESRVSGGQRFLAGLLRDAAAILSESVTGADVAFPV